MEKFSRQFVLAAGIVMCGALCANGASAATPEQDDAIQRAGIEYNRKYDMEHGYYVPPVVEFKSTAPVARPAGQTQYTGPRAPQQVVKMENRPAQPQQRSLASSPAAVRPQGQLQANSQVQKKESRDVKFTKQQQAKTVSPQTQNVRQAPAQARPVAQPQQQRTVRQVQQPQQTQQRTLVKEEWMKARYAPTTEADRAMQEAALDYNRKFDMRYAHR